MDEAAIKDLEAMQEIQALVVGREVGESGTKHLQGYVGFRNPRRMQRVKDMLPGSPHLEHSRSAAAIEYCEKEGDMVANKKPPGAGKRTDINDFMKAIKEGATNNELIEAHPGSFIRYQRGLTAARIAYSLRDKQPPTVVWIWGGAGVGKTRLAEFLCRSQFSVSETWWSLGSLRWFDGYTSQRAAILDDLRSTSCEFSFLLRLLDRYPFTVEFKGGTVPWAPALIVITGPVTPLNTYPESFGDIGQLTRRLHCIVALDGDGTLAISGSGIMADRLSRIRCRAGEFFFERSATPEQEPNGA